MPHLFAIVLCILILAGLAGLVRLEYNRARKGPRLALSAAYLGLEKQPVPTGAPRSRALQHEIGH